MIEYCWKRCSNPSQCPLTHWLQWSLRQCCRQRWQRAVSKKTFLNFGQNVIKYRILLMAMPLDTLAAEKPSLKARLTSKMEQNIPWSLEKSNMAQNENWIPRLYRLLKKGYFEMSHWNYFTLINLHAMNDESRNKRYWRYELVHLEDIL